jgi:hypothetical protein
MNSPNDVLTETEPETKPATKTVAKLVTRPRAGAKPSPLDDPIAQLLIARADLLVGSQYRQQRMFVQFDAWTDPRFLGWLQKNGHLLRGNAKNLFVTRRPPFNINLLICGFALLKDVPLDRAIRRASGQVYGVPVRVSADVARLLDANHTTVREVIREVAAYLHRIFSRHFQQKGRTTPSPRLETAFARFASGQLRIKSGIQQQLNAEPDSAYFFVFAEFCIQAAYYRARPSREWWLSLGGLFASLQEVYCLRYHRNGAQRRVAEYGDMFYDGRRPIPDEVLLDHAASVRVRDGTLSKLAERVTWSAHWNFFDDVM